MPLSIALIGPPDIRVDGAPLEVDTRKAVALLAYLAAEGGAHPRDRLVDLLWPDGDVDRGRSSLRRTLSALRSGLGGRWIEADRTFVALDRDGVVLDLDELRLLIDENHGHDGETACGRCVTTLSAATELHRGPFLDGFFVRGAGEFDTWVTTQAEQVARQLDTAYRRLAAAHATDAAYGSAALVAERRIRLDPLKEDAHRTLMLYRAWSGDRSGAVDAYRRLVATLDVELGVPPLEETTELYEAILGEELPREPIDQTRRPPPGLAPATSPLVGRDHVLDEAHRLLATDRVLLVEGVSGSGVTRILEEISVRLRSSGDTILWASGSPATASVPYGAIHDALFGVLEAPEVAADLQRLPPAVRDEASRLFPSLAVGVPPSPVTPARFLDALARVISVVPSPVLVIDDFHELDSASAEAVAFFSRRATRLGLCIVAGALTGAVTDPAVEDVMASLRSLGAVTLTPLNIDAVTHLAAAMSPGIDAASVLANTGGLAVFVVEALRSGTTSPTPPLRKQIADRVTRLGGSARQVYEGLVVLGRSADPGLLGAVTGRSAEETDAALDLLVQHGLVQERPDGGVACAHAFLAEAVMADMSAARRRLMNRRAAGALTSAGGEPGRIAHHLRAAGDHDEAARWFFEAGLSAMGVMAWREAIGHFEAALASGHLDRSVIHRTLASAAMRDGRYDQAVAAYEAALANDDPDRAGIEHSLGEVHRRLRRWDLAVAHYERATAAGPDDEMAAIVLADRAYVEHQRSGSAVSAPLVVEALAMAEASGSDRALTRSHNVAGITSDDVGIRVEHLQTALSHAHDPYERIAVLNNLAGVVPPARTIDLMQEALGLAGDLGDRHLIAALHNRLADAWHERGEEEAAREALAEAVRDFAEITIGDDEPWVPEVWLLTEW